jgi:small nuclear ribonucleoprotein (snRNP)-like protein
LNCSNLIARFDLKNGKEVTVQTLSLRCVKGAISGVDGSESVYGFEHE